MPLVSHDYVLMYEAVMAENAKLRAALISLTNKAYNDFDGGRKLRRGDIDKARAALGGRNA